MLAVIHVTDVLDGELHELEGNGRVSLREAIEMANNDIAIDASVKGDGVDTIVFSQNLHDPIELVAGELRITSPIRIIGRGVDETVISGLDSSRLFAIDASAGEVVLRDMSLIAGYSAETGGAVLNQGNLTLDAVALRQNHATLGGGAIHSTGLLTTQRTTLDANSTDGLGGAILNESTHEHGLSLEQSTISNNTAVYGAGIGVRTIPAGRTSLDNVTITGNTATQRGGGIEAASGHVTITYTTITANSAGEGGGVSTPAENSSASLELGSSIFAGNVGADFSSTAAESVTSHGYNIFGGAYPNAAGVNDSDIENVSLEALALKPLAANGGPTLTHSLGWASIAKDWGPPESSQSIRVDQRGYSKALGTPADAGAFEIVLDFGDAPTAAQSGFVSDYPTLSVDDGAAHIIGGPRLGNLVVATLDGMPDPLASWTSPLSQELRSDLYVFPSSLLDAVKVATGDINNDGLIDIVAQRTETAQLIVFFGRGDERFSESRSHIINLDMPARQLILADTNGDQHLDIVVTNIGRDSVATYLGNGDGTFAPPRKTWWRVDDIYDIADLNGDGKSDLIGESPRGLSIALAAGDGYFQSRARLPRPDGRLVVAGAVADLDQDGDVDIIGVYGYRRIVAHYNDGTAHFSPGVALFSQDDASVTAIEFAQFAGDGLLDMIAYDSHAHSIIIGEVDGSTLRIVDTFNGYVGEPPVGSRPFRLSDRNGDGRSEVHFQGYSEEIWELSYSPTWERTLSQVSLRDTPSFNVFLDVAEVTNDGQPNYFMSYGEYGSREYDAGILMISAEPIGYTGIQLDNLASATSSVGIADFDEDGYDDIAFPVRNESSLGLAFGGESEAGEPEFISLPRTIEAVHAADINGDGHKDVVVQYHQGLYLGVMLGNGDGTFVEMPVDMDAFRRSLKRFAVQDLNQDGFDDVVTLNDISDIQVYYGRSTGEILLGSSVESTFRGTHELSIGDMNGDSYADIVTEDYIALSDHNGLFSVDRVLNLPSRRDEIVPIATADLDDDGVADLVSIVDDQTTIVVDFFGRDGIQESAQLLRNSPYDRWTGVVAGDFNQDGHMDVVGVSQIGELRVWLNAGERQFHRDLRFQLHPSFDDRVVQVGDLNDDDILDVIVISSSDRTLQTLLGHGDGTVESAQLLGVVGNASENSPLAADFNVDGNI
ncbi:MAG: VCBS repeat-containing protein, partial [Planctomycetales bacterium]|nr:VCBS repeat-containing protein [Planctomycetales bacterium]